MDKLETAIYEADLMQRGVNRVAMWLSTEMGFDQDITSAITLGGEMFMAIDMARAELSKLGIDKRQKVDKIPKGDDGQVVDDE